MGGKFVIEMLEPKESGDHEQPSLRAIADLAFAEARRLEDLLNMWDPQSELSQWNEQSRAQVAGPIPMVTELAVQLAGALAFAAEVDGAFDPTVASVLRQLGFYGGTAVELSESNRDLWKELVGHELLDVLWSEDAEDAEDDRGHQTPVVTSIRGVEVDLSSLAKGWAAERVAQVLQEHGITNALVSAGSSSLVAFGPGTRDGEEPRGWPVRLPDPRAPDGEVIWWLHNEALSTSGQSSITLKGMHRGKSHILDPRSLEPIRHRTEMVVVRGPDAVRCDMLSTALLVKGLEQARVWLADPERGERLNDVMIYAAPIEGSEPEIVTFPR